MIDTPKELEQTTVAMSPGSPYAIEHGCTCPVLDNSHGQGVGLKDNDGNPLYWISADCLIHSTPQSTAIK